MTDDDYARTLEELDRLLNDPDVAMQPALIWRLLAEVSGHDMHAAGAMMAGKAQSRP
jgi:hypothetical protein